MRRLLITTLCGLLAVTLAGIPGGSVAAAPDPVVPVVALEATPDRLPLNHFVELAASVERPPSDPSSGDVPGQVRFSVALAEAGLWGVGAVELGPVALVDGVATRSLHLEPTVLPFLDPDDDVEEVWVAARYEPEHDGETYDEFALADSAPQRIAIGPYVTTTTVTGPSSAVVGSPTTLTAAVSPADANGSLTFLVDGSPVGEVEMLGGTAELTFTFTSPGDAIVGARFESWASYTWTDSEDLAGRSVTVAAAPPGPPPMGVATSTTVTGPTAATAGAPTTLEARVLPAAASGTVQFSVDGVPVGGPVPVSGGVASLPHTFASAGLRTVRAAFETVNPLQYAGSADAVGRTVAVAKAATTTTLTVPPTASVGKWTPLSATVVPASADGTVQFYVDGDPVGEPVPVAGGTASQAYRFPVPGTRPIGATFVPADPTSYEPSSDSVALSVSAFTLAIVITGPVLTAVGQAATLSASVQPADVVGRLRFFIDGTRVGSAEIVDGVASLEHVFTATGIVAVDATFTPDEPGAFWPGASMSHSVVVLPASWAEAVSHTVSTVDVATEGDGCVTADRASSPGRPNAAGYPYPQTVRPSGFVLQFGIRVHEIDPITKMSFWTDLVDMFGGNLPREFYQQLLAARARLDPNACADGQGSARADIVTQDVECIPADVLAYWCPLDLPAGARVSAAASLPMPKQLAGKRVRVRTTMSYVDPQTGDLVRIGKGGVRADVPKRTVLSARLAPIPGNLASTTAGERVAYRLLVSNDGRVDADRVRACISLGDGARVVVAKGAEVRDRRACWTLRDLPKRSSVTRKLILRTPTASGSLRVAASIKPRKNQADPLRLVTVLEVG